VEIAEKHGKTSGFEGQVATLPTLPTGEGWHLMARNDTTGHGSFFLALPVSPLVPARASHPPAAC
jgi:hypothetical protein